MKKIRIFLLLVVAVLLLCACAADTGTDRDSTAGDDLRCTVTILCDTLYASPASCDEALYAILPEGGVLLPETAYTASPGQTVFEVLTEVCRENKIHLEHSTSPVYSNSYIEGIGNIYEFDGGPLSGWMYAVNDTYPSFSASAYRVEDGDRIVFRYTLALGDDIGGDYSAQIENAAPAS
ncbi:MAG: DUF4430 domain-containing protein [Ruminococcaceae bacterium]|nr:DUF4430 domain-containing protein [Oscillospiraceae bacterium]